MITVFYMMMYTSHTMYQFNKLTYKSISCSYKKIRIDLITSNDWNNEIK